MSGREGTATFYCIYFDVFGGDQVHIPLRKACSADSLENTNSVHTTFTFEARTVIKNK